MADETAKRPGGRPRLFTDPEEFATRTEAYFDQLSDKPPTMAGLCLFLGFDDRDSFTRYETYGDAFSRTVKRARLRIEVDRNERLLGRADATAGVIFDLKNNHGWRDQAAVEHTGRNGGPIEYANLTEEQIDARLAALAAGAGEPDPEPEA